MIMVNRKPTIKFQILSYLSFTFLFTWIVWGILYASSKGLVSYTVYYNHFLLMVVVGGSMPSIMSIIFTYFFHGSDGIKLILKKLIIWKVNPLIYIFVLFYTVLSYYIPLWICNITGSTYRFYFSISFYNLLSSFLITIVIGGPLGEELGWRGYVLPKLQSKLNPIYSSILLGIVWSCWHLPLFFIMGTAQYGFPFILFVFEDIFLSIIFTWVYSRTEESLIFPILLHASFNTTGSLIWYNPNSYFIKSFNKYTVIALIIQLIFLLCVLLDMIRKTASKSITSSSPTNL